MANYKDFIRLFQNHRILIVTLEVSINLVLGENGILKVAKRAKENMELVQIEDQTKLNELYMQIEKEEESSEEGNQPYTTISAGIYFGGCQSNYLIYKKI